MSARSSRALAAPRRVGVVALLLALLAAGLTAGPTQAADLPSKAQWLADTHAAMLGSRIYVGQRAGTSAVGRKLAVNFDIDNTTLASHYDFGAPVPVVLRFARDARAHGVLLLFNTARAQGGGRLLEARRQLAAAGYRVTQLCGRRTDEGVAQGKQRCRSQFVASGYTIIANVGNRSTDFVGGNYERAFRLPDYDGQLS